MTAQEELAHWKAEARRLRRVNRRLRLVLAEVAEVLRWQLAYWARKDERMMLAAFNKAKRAVGNRRLLARFERDNRGQLARSSEDKSHGTPVEPLTVRPVHRGDGARFCAVPAESIQTACGDDAASMQAASVAVVTCGDCLDRLAARQGSARP